MNTQLPDGPQDPPKEPPQSRSKGEPWWRSVVVNGLVPFILVVAGAGSTVGGEAFEAAALHQESAAHSVLVQVPSGAPGDSYILYPNHAAAAAPTTDNSKDGHHHDCPPQVREHLEALGLWNDLQSIHQHLKESDEPPTKSSAPDIRGKLRDEKEENVDIARELLGALLVRIADCAKPESAT